MQRPFAFFFSFGGVFVRVCDSFVSEVVNLCICGYVWICGYMDMWICELLGEEKNEIGRRKNNKKREKAQIINSKRAKDRNQTLNSLQFFLFNQDGVLLEMAQNLRWHEER